MERKDFEKLINSTAVRNEIEQKQALYKTMRDINEPLLELMDAIGDDQRMVGVSDSLNVFLTE